MCREGNESKRRFLGHCISTMELQRGAELLQRAKKEDRDSRNNIIPEQSLGVTQLCNKIRNPNLLRVGVKGRWLMKPKS